MTGITTLPVATRALSVRTFRDGGVSTMM